MLRRSFLALTGAAAAPLIAAASARAAGPEKAAVTVFAAASLREAFDAAGVAFRGKTGFPVRFSYGGSDQLATQILAGAPADVFASANAAQMKRVADAGAATSSVPFARNRLVVVVPARDAAVTTFDDLAKPGVKLVLAAPSVPVGGYARTAFTTYAQHGGPADFAARASANVVSEETDVKAVATKVALGEADAGVVYATDVAPLGAKVRTLAFPAGTAPEAVYPIAVLSAATNAEGARAFVAFVTSAAGRAFLTARGFA